MSEGTERRAFDYARGSPKLATMEREADKRRVAGADGCPGGWICVTAHVEAEGRLAVADVAVVPDFAALLALTRDCDAVAVDIPIGLSADGRREADFEARRRIGPRRSSVFPAPPRFVLDVPDYETANSASKARFGRGLQKQTFNILPKIREADAAMTSALQERTVESHPEVCFWALGGGRHVMEAKRTPEGQAERLRRLETAYGASARSLAPPKGAAWNDLYDACVLAWTASRVAAGTAVHLPSAAQRDERGLRMEIVY
jgi:predicted RNase H-like nuclease